MTGDESPIQITEERVTLKKYDGDPPQPGEAKEPVEVIELIDGVVVQHMKKGEPHGLNE